VLKTGLTVSASIPVAVISIALFRAMSKLGMRDATILENNVVQTAGSAGESIAFGVGVTMPAILILGFDLQVARVILVSVLGGLLGILMMIPLRRALIVQQHGTLKYPEGTACAEVLKAGASEESRAVAEKAGTAVKGKAATLGATTIFAGFGLGILYNVAMKVFPRWKDSPEKIFDAPMKGGSVSCEITPELLGVGYVIGPRIGAIMAGGGVLSYLLLIPMITAPSICDRARSGFATKPASTTTVARGTTTVPSAATSTSTTIATYVRKLRCIAMPRPRPAGSVGGRRERRGRDRRGLVGQRGRAGRRVTAGDREHELGQLGVDRDL